MMYLCIGILFFSVSVYLYSKSTHSIYNLIVYVGLSLGAVLLQVLFVVGDHVTGNGVSNALLYHLVNDLTGIAYKIFLPQIVAGSSLVLLAIFFLLYSVYLSRGRKKSRYCRPGMHFY